MKWSAYFTDSAAVTAGPDRWARWLLRAAVAGFCLGWGLWLIGRLGSQTGAWLLFHAELPAGPIGRGERAVGWILLGLAAAAWMPGRWAMLAGLAGLLAAADAVMGVLQGGYAFSSWTPAAHGLRIAAPWAFALLVWSMATGGTTARQAALIVLRLGAAAVFLAHGLEAIMGHPGFQDFMVGTAERFFGLMLDEEQVQPWLTAIGMMDIALAALILSGRGRAWLWWAAIWGAITAVARVTTYGWEVYGEILLRLPHVTGPLAIWALTRSSPVKTRKQPDV